MSNVAIAGHPTIGAQFVYRPDLPDMTHLPASEYVARNGDAVEVRAVFHDWNGVEGLTIFYVYVLGTGKFTHFSERELGIEPGTH